ncbi:MucR family transcriptional regulator [Aminobacter sp. Piv2-1]|uniref:MucR family transcriptional regulator n=1 Tax=Aminobacter sp. Piv2-1 TaxID=3031122 RepID=UPI00309C63D8
MTDEATRNDSSDAVALASDIVVAYVSNNSVPRAELPALIADIHAAIERLRTGATPVPGETRSPAVPIKKSVTADYIVCLEDGKKFKSLKRHLSTHYNLSPDEYRQKWSLPRDYPMVAPAYAAARSSLAKSMGLGRKRAAQAAAPVVAEKPKRAPARAAAAPAAKARTAKSAAKPARRKKADA